MQLVLTFQQAAWQQLGKIPNPIDNKIERNLEQARHSIDLLDMLKARTKGNLNSEETAFLEHVLRELKLNYIDELEKDKQSPASAAEPQAGENAAPEAPAA